MMIVRFRSKGEHEDIMKKVRKMRKFAEELEECLDDVMEDDEMEFRGGSYRGGSYRDDEDRMEMQGGRYSYRRGRR